MLRNPMTDYMLPPEEEVGAFEQRWNVAPDRQMPVADVFRQAGMPYMEQYGEANPAAVYAAADKAKREEERRARILSSRMPGQDTAFADRPTPHGPTSQRDRAMMEFGRDMLVPQTPLDVGLMVAGGPVGGKLARGGAATLGALFEPDEAEARGKLKTLFDYSKVRDVPNVKQFDLPRYDPPRGISERVEDLVKNKRVEQQMLEHIQKGKDINAETFYYNEPLRQAFIDELGKKQGPQSFERYMDYVAASSPRSDVETNARNASYYYMLEKQGLPVPPQGGKNPEPYGHLAQNLHRENAEKIRSGEYFDPVKNPKPLSFSQNLQGNFAPVTVDAHALKLPAMLAEDPRFVSGSIKLEKGQPTINPSKMLESGEITMEDALARPVYWAGRPNPNEYGAMERYYKRLAAETGLTPAQTQAAAWAGGGKITGLESVAGDPFMRSVENRAIKTAAERGISPAEALSQMMRGKAPLLGVPLGAGVIGGVADQGNYNYQPEERL